MARLLAKWFKAMCTSVNYTASFSFNLYYSSRTHHQEPRVTLLFIFHAILSIGDTKDKTKRTRKQKQAFLLWPVVPFQCIRSLPLPHRQTQPSGCHLCSLSICSWQWFYKYFPVTAISSSPPTFTTILCVCVQFHLNACIVIIYVAYFAAAAAAAIAAALDGFDSKT